MCDSWTPVRQSFIFSRRSADSQPFFRSDLPRSAYDIPSQEELLKLYCSTIGRPYPLKGFTTAVSFAFYRGAIMLQGIIARQVSGQLTQSISGIFNADVVRMTEYAKETLEIGESGNVKL